MTCTKLVATGDLFQAVYDPSQTLSPSILRNRDSGVSQSPFFGNLFDSHTVHPDERRGKQTTSKLVPSHSLFK